MTYEIVDKNSIKIIGRQIVTNNAENKFLQAWQEFFTEYTGGQIVALYTDYDSDYRGNCAFVIGVVTEENDFTKATVSGKYAKYVVDSRDMVMQVWQCIWQSDLDRAYLTDYEKYNQDGSVEVYISIK